MKKLIIPIFLLSLFVAELEARSVKGQIHFENEIVEVKFKIPGLYVYYESILYEFQYRVVYLDPNGERRILKPHQAKEIRFNYANQDFRMLSVKTPSNIKPKQFHNAQSTNVFLRVGVDGGLKLFHFYKNPSWFNFTNFGPIYFLQRQDDLYKRVRPLFFRRDMIKYFQDCPELSKRIKKGHYPKRSIVTMINHYNSNCN